MQLIDVIPRQFIIDGYDEITDPVGMVGNRLEVDADMLVGKIISVQNIIKSMERADIKLDGIVAEAFASAEICLTPDERDIGAVLLDVGGSVTDISVFQGKRLVFMILYRSAGIMSPMISQSDCGYLIRKPKRSSASSNLR